MEVIEDEGSARRLDRVQRLYEALQPTGRRQPGEAEPAIAHSCGAALSEEEGVARELSAEVEHAMSMENRAAGERAVVAREEAQGEAERDVEAEVEAEP